MKLIPQMEPGSQGYCNMALTGFTPFYAIAQGPYGGGGRRFSAHENMLELHREHDWILGKQFGKIYQIWLYHSG